MGTHTGLSYELNAKNAADECLTFLRHQIGFILSSHINRGLYLSWSLSKWLSSPDTPCETGHLLKKRRSFQVHENGPVSNNLPLPLWLSFQKLDREFLGKRPEIMQLAREIQLGVWFSTMRVSLLLQRSLFNHPEGLLLLLLDGDFICFSVQVPY